MSAFRDTAAYIIYSDELSFFSWPTDGHSTLEEM